MNPLRKPVAVFRHNRLFLLLVNFLGMVVLYLFIRLKGDLMPTDPETWLIGVSVFAILLAASLLSMRTVMIFPAGIEVQSLFGFRVQRMKWADMDAVKEEDLSTRSTIIPMIRHKNFRITLSSRSGKKIHLVSLFTENYQELKKIVEEKILESERTKPD